MRDRPGMDRGARSSQGAGGKKSLLLRVLLFLRWQLPGRAGHGELSTDLLPKLLTTTPLLFTGVGEGGVALVVLAHQWARGEGDKGRPLAVDQLETEDDVCPEPGALR